MTFSVNRRRRLLDLDPPRRVVLGVLNSLLANTGSRCIGYVLMPEHVHAIAEPWACPAAAAAVACVVAVVV